ncbi:MAG: transposase [Parabacteroides sp.]|nr:transposase [Parabacteroides sp.]
MKTKKSTYSEEFKLSLIREFYSLGITMYAFVKKHSLSYATFLRWLRAYESENKLRSLSSDQSEDDMANRSKDSYKEENAQLKKRIRELEKALEFSQLETLARDMMIDKAEEYFDISIRKKSGAK